MHKKDCYGIHRAYQHDGSREVSTDLFSLVSKNGFDAFSAEGITSYLSFRYPIQNYTMFQGISKYASLPNSTEPTEEWTPSIIEEEMKKDASEQMLIKKAEELLLRSIDNLAKDKKRIGITLSGGVDSSLLLAMLRYLYPDREIYSYSIGFYGEDEFEYSRDVASRFSTKHWEKVLLADDYLGSDSILQHLIKQKCAPLHPNELALAIAEAQAKADLCDIVFCGEGADDIFGGYGRNFRMYLQYLPATDYTSFLLDRYRYFAKDDVSGLIKKEYYLDDTQLLRPIFSEPGCPPNTEEKMRYFIQRVHTRGLIERGMNALKLSKCEPAFPFIDADLVEFANKIPLATHVKWKEGFSDNDFMNMNPKDVSEIYDVPKYLLKKVAETYLPNHIIYRPKHGFPVPFESWLGELKSYQFNKLVFESSDISRLSGWKKFMLLNLDCFVNLFAPYIR